MKKIYLLSAVACLFAFNANAGDDLAKWGKVQGLNDVKFDQASNCVSFSKAESGFTWDCQFNPPTWYAPSKGKSEAFEFCFDARYNGDGTDGDGKGHITFIQGRQFGGFNGDLAGLCTQLGIEQVEQNWMLQGAVEQLVIEDYTGAPEDFAEGVCNRNVNFYPTKDWAHFSMTGHLGRHAQDSVDLEFELGKMAGSYGLKNIQFIVKGEVFAEYFMAPTAIAEDAAVTAYVANDVIFASEAADVVVYNINGVAVKSAKNVTSLSVADLKAGLYIAKVGNATVKFVK
jgi:hypothetical protein